MGITSNHRFFHWFYYHQKKHHYFNIGSGIFIWLFLGLTLPFGVYENNLSSYPKLLLFLLPFGLTWTFISYSTDYLTKHVFAVNVSESHQKDLKVFLLKLFFLIHIFFLIRNFFCDWSCVDGYEYLQLWFACILMLALVYIPFSLYARYKFYQKMVGSHHEETDRLFELKGEGKNTLKILLDEIVYIKSDGNYVDIVTINEDNIHETHVFRASLKSLASQLKAYSQFIRVHRSFFVNLRFISSVEKKGMIKILYGDTEFEMPVSKKYQNDLTQLVK